MTKFLITNKESMWFNAIFEGERLPPTDTGETYVRMHPSQMIFHENEVSEVTDAHEPQASLKSFYRIDGPTSISKCYLVESPHIPTPVICGTEDAARTLCRIFDQHKP